MRRYLGTEFLVAPTPKSHLLRQMFQKQKVGSVRNAAFRLPAKNALAMQCRLHSIKSEPSLSHLKVQTGVPGHQMGAVDESDDTIRLPILARD